VCACMCVCACVYVHVCLCARSCVFAVRPSARAQETPGAHANRLTNTPTRRGRHTTKMHTTHRLYACSMCVCMHAACAAHIVCGRACACVGSKRPHLGGVATISRVPKRPGLCCRIYPFHRALLQKRHTILRSLLIVATPYRDA